MGAFHRVLSLQLVAGVANGVALSQTPGAAGPLVLNGASLVTLGVATFDVPRRVIITSVGNDSGKLFTITGTGRNGAAISRTIAGGNTAAVATDVDFATVTGISVNAATAAAVTAGTNATASSVPMIVDRFINPNTLTTYLNAGAGNTNTVEICYDELAPGWDVETKTPNWIAYDVTTKLVAFPITMIRLSQSAGTALSTLTVITPMKAGRL